MLTKCYCATYFLRSTAVSVFVPMQYMHDLHKAMGSLFFCCSVLHAAAHVARWTLRLELSALSHSVGSSGTVALFLLVLSVAPMYRAGMFRRLFSCSFEIGHWLHLPYFCG